MAHPEQMQFVADVKLARPSYFVGREVLEVGSRDVNGSVRPFFNAPARYVGLDCTPGPGVDVVCLAHEYDSPSMFDVVISCEAFEHDPHLEKTVANAVRLLRPGGLFVATAASEKRQEHGTLRSTGLSEVYGPDPAFYRGLTRDYLYGLLVPHMNALLVSLHRDGLDVYAWGIRGK